MTKSSHAHLRLSDAQLAIARESGFPSWARLKRHIEKPTLSDQLNCRIMSGLKMPHFAAPWNCSMPAT